MSNIEHESFFHIILGEVNHVKGSSDYCVECYEKIIKLWWAVIDSIIIDYIKQYDCKCRKYQDKNQVKLNILSQHCHYCNDIMAKIWDELQEVEH